MTSATLATCPVCNGHGQVAAGVACPVCEGTGVADSLRVAAYRNVLEQAAVEAAAERARRQAVAEMDETWRRAAAARLHADRAEAALAAVQELATRDAEERGRLLARLSLHPMAAPILPPLPPGHTPTVTGQAVPDPLLVIDSIQVRELDVWGQANIPSLGSGGAYVVIAPTGDVTGAGDTAAIMAQVNAGNDVWLTSGTFYITQLALNTGTLWQRHIRGNGFSTVINAVGTGDAIIMQNPTNPANPPYPNLGGSLGPFVIDGTSAGTGSAGAHLADCHDYSIDLLIRNFTSAGAIGLHVDNLAFSANNIRGSVHLINNTTGLVFDSSGAGGQVSIEHVYLQVTIQLGAAQQGIVVQGGTFLTASHLIGSMNNLVITAGNQWTITGSSHIVQTFIWFRHEFEVGGTSTTAATISFGTGTNFVTTCGGMLNWQNQSQWVSSNVGTGNSRFQFNGVVSDPNLIADNNLGVGVGYAGTTVTTPAVPASGTPVTNNTGVNVWVTAVAGTLTAATQIGGTNVGDTSTRGWFLPSGVTIQLTYSAAPTSWLWQAMS